MSKRKREKADEESITPEQSKRAKKQKTKATITPRAKASLNAAVKYTEGEGSVQALHDERGKEFARKIAKQEKKALARAQRDESRLKVGNKAVEADDNSGLAEGQDQRSVEKGQVGNWNGSQEQAKEGGQSLTKKQRSKKEKRKDRNVRSSGKERKKKHVERATWKASDPVGGQMLDVDPVFSPDDM